MIDKVCDADPMSDLAGQRLIERLDGLNFSPCQILHAGCGVGRQAQSLHKRFPKANIVAMDHSPVLVAQAKKRQGWWRRRFEVIQGDCAHAPIKTGLLDLVVAHFVSPDPRAIQSVLESSRRTLKPQGLLLMSTLGPSTLVKDERPLEPLMQAPDVQTLASWLTQSGFNEPVLDAETLTMAYASLQPLKNDLVHRGLLDKDAPIDANLLNDLTQARGDRHEGQWEIIYASAWAPDAGQTLRSESGEVASVPLDQISIRRR